MSYSEFVYSQKTNIVFGGNAISNAGKFLEEMGAKKVMIVTYSLAENDNVLLNQMKDEIVSRNIACITYDKCVPNPSDELVNAGAALFSSSNCDFVLAIGGGSAIDTAKAIAMLAANKSENGIWEYMLGKPFEAPGVPLGVILTIAATGSECNGSFVISNYKTQEKLICTDDSIKPAFSVCDPKLTYTVSKWQTACGVADIISHILEQYLYQDNDCDVSDGMSLGVLKAVVRWGPEAVNNPENYDARANLMWAGTIAMSGLLGSGHDQNWMTHMLEHAVSAVYNVSHGAGMACLFPYYLDYLAKADEKNKIDRLGEVLFGIQPSPEAKAEIIAAFRTFFSSLGMPLTLHELTGKPIEPEIIDRMVEKALPWGEMPAGGYPVFTPEDAAEIFTKAAG